MDQCFSLGENGRKVARYDGALPANKTIKLCGSTTTSAPRAKSASRCSVGGGRAAPEHLSIVLDFSVLCFMQQANWRLQRGGP